MFRGYLLRTCGVARDRSRPSRAADRPVSRGTVQVEFIDPADGGRPLDYMLIYPAAPDSAATPFKIFLSTNLHLYMGAPIVADGLKRPLVMFSHGAGGNGSGYAWFGEYLASHGYLVAMVYHYRANTYDFERIVRAQQVMATAARYQPGHHPSAPGQGVGAAHRPESDWRGGAFAGGIYLHLARWRQDQSRAVSAISARMEEQPDGAGVFARADAP